MRLYIRTDEREEPPLELMPGERLLVGRQPAPAEGARTVAIASPSVSGNHVLVTCTESAVEVVDLESRNGTWLELVPNRRVTVEPGEGVRLHLAPGADAEGNSDGPADAEWGTESEFGPALVSAVQSWLDRRSVPVRARMEGRRSGNELEDSLGRIPLDAKSDLVIDAVHTMDARWLSILRRITRYTERQVARLQAEKSLGSSGLIVASRAMKRAVQQVVEAAARPGRALLILGPSGSGKEGLARCYHTRTRPTGPFVSRNCAQFRFGKDLVLSELFGAERGSFTGATRTLVGAVETADGGTLFLDELGELPLDVQSVFLRFLDHGEYTKAGGSAVQTSDVHLVAATNKDLRAACADGSFRRDLWFRIAAEVVEVPPLSERFEDVTAYLRTRSRGESSLYDAFDPSALEVLRQHRWEGNFRELINFVNRLPGVDRIDADTCRRVLAAGALSVAPPSGSQTASTRAPIMAEGDWTSLFTRAAEAFSEDRGGDRPRNWNDVKDLVESYLKPLLFAALSDSLGIRRREDIDLRVASERVAADRGTAAKQLERYLARFASRIDG